MSQRPVYDDAFFADLELGALRSARIIVPILLNIVKVQGVLDVGCGRAAWLKAFLDNGVTDIHGLDGSWVKPDSLLIDPSAFTPTDLTQPLKCARTYDLAVCLEVVEHLPAAAGRALVRELARATPLVLFSAAIPGQGGVNHVNEQWPPYWTDLFAQLDFVRLDPIRRHIWQDPRVDDWYRQNICLFARRAKIAEVPALQQEEELARTLKLECIHEHILSRYTYFGGLLREIPRAAVRALKSRMPWNR